MRTIRQVLNAGGPDPAMLAAACQLIGLGDMLTPQRRLITGLSAPTFKLSDIDPSIPGIRVGGMAFPPPSSSAAFVCVGSPSYDVPPGSTGLTIGAGNYAVRVVAKDGFTVRYAQFSATSPSSTTTSYRSNQALKVWFTGNESNVEIWTQLATDSDGFASSTAAEVVAAIRATAGAMRALSIVDFDGGNGSQIALDKTTIGINQPIIGTFILEGASDPEMRSPGIFYASHDGNLVALNTEVPEVLLEYIATPRMSLDEPFPGSV